jgi:hypothetical protein
MWGIERFGAIASLFEVEDRVSNIEEKIGSAGFSPHVQGSENACGLKSAKPVTT